MTRRHAKRAWPLLMCWNERLCLGDYMQKFAALAVTLLICQGATAQTVPQPAPTYGVLGTQGGRFVLGRVGEVRGVYLLDTQTGKLWTPTMLCEDVKRRETCNDTVMTPMVFHDEQGRPVPGPLADSVRPAPPAPPSRPTPPEQKGTKGGVKYLQQN